ncbi:hypothetical protein GCM10007886_45110 [Methylobacterium gregans]|uniref:Uncharacterized protein n=1 Tax=Methylobacterium gregans TaxID=374424 RepID=A0AA37HTQ2_9HYPH|nr:hypothetical protein NBEOAGPD_3956 [Methylobacterium gregans]GLS56326.1 hypothetical protein GCM10007886_45110 [Methylobacterium gregans]
MSRNRVRRSFTVETKARGRQAPAVLPVRAPLLEPSAPAFPSLEAAALFGVAPARRSEDGAEAVERSAPRRILPSLIELPQPEPEAVEAVAPEPRLPRVRRVKLPRAEAQGKAARREAVSPEVPTPERAVPQPVRDEPARLAQPLPEKPRQSRPKTAEAGRRIARRAEKALPLGERWKRRLPRVCW